MKAITGLLKILEATAGEWSAAIFGPPRLQGGCVRWARDRKRRITLEMTAGR
jgi:hypothetical protein